MNHHSPRPPSSTTATTSPARPKPGGRVLGRPIPNRTVLSPALAHRPGLAVSPSESSASYASQSSFGIISGVGGHGSGHRRQDSATASGYSTPVGNGTGNGLAVGGGGIGRYGGETESPGRMICPICETDMVTLLQLNRHLDEEHKEVEEVEKDDISSWFQKNLLKAKQFQPVALINQKLKGLDVFESNDNFHPTIQLPTPAPSIASTASITSIATITPPVVKQERDPEEFVTRQNWQKAGHRDLCTEPACGKLLGNSNGIVNCRKCGKLFCEEHTMYQIKLSRAALHEPVRGAWCRVCESCYVSRDGYLDHKGFVRDHTSDFKSLRQKNVDKQHLETSRLDKRLTKLTQVLTDPTAAEMLNVQQQSAASKLWPVNLNGLRNQRKLLEQTIVNWEDDAKVPNCPFCKQTFTNFSLRKHHCRLCGKVVCGDTRTGCSSEVGLNVNVNVGGGKTLTEKMGEVALDVRICRECNGVLFSKRDFMDEVARKPPDQKSYETMVEFEKGIITMLPRFQKLLATLQDSSRPPTPQQRSEASKTRKRLLDAFTRYDTAAKRIVNLPTDSPTQKQLQRSIYLYSVEFLQTHMFPLKALPKILKQTKSSKLGNGHHRGLGSPASIIDDASSVVSSNPEVDAEEKLLKEQLAVLEEQKFLVGEMIASAKASRRFEEIGALAQSLGELEKEVEKVEGQIKDFEKRNPVW
ncbi:carboxypeptidase Y-deficient [Orbilia oligospora]|nr:carboxypeptidase Y-deficient [Orbilia oligospora]